MVGYRQAAEMCNGHSQRVRIPVPKRSRRRGDGGTGVDAGAEGHEPLRDTAFIDADALPLSEQFASSYMQRSHVTKSGSEACPPPEQPNVQLNYYILSGILLLGSLQNPKLSELTCSNRTFPILPCT